MVLSPPTLCALSQRQSFGEEAVDDVAVRDDEGEGAEGGEDRREEGGGECLDGVSGERESSPLVLGTPPPDV